MTFLLRIGQFAIYTMSKGIWEMNPASIGGPIGGDLLDPLRNILIGVPLDDFPIFTDSLLYPADRRHTRRMCGVGTVGFLHSRLLPYEHGGCSTNSVHVLVGSRWRKDLLQTAMS